MRTRRDRKGRFIAFKIAENSRKPPKFTKKSRKYPKVTEKSRNPPPHTNSTDFLCRSNYQKGEFKGSN